MRRAETAAAVAVAHRRRRRSDGDCRAAWRGRARMGLVVHRHAVNMRWTARMTRPTDGRTDPSSFCNRDGGRPARAASITATRAIFAGHDRTGTPVGRSGGRPAPELFTELFSAECQMQGDGVATGGMKCGDAEQHFDARAVSGTDQQELMLHTVCFHRVKVRSLHFHSFIVFI